MSFDVTLVLDPSDFTFDNFLYSLRFETTTSADIIISAETAAPPTVKIEPVAHRHY